MTNCLRNCVEGFGASPQACPRRLRATLEARHAVRIVACRYPSVSSPTLCRRRDSRRNVGGYCCKVRVWQLNMRAVRVRMLGDIGRRRRRSPEEWGCCSGGLSRSISSARRFITGMTSSITLRCSGFQSLAGMSGRGPATLSASLSNCVEQCRPFSTRASSPAEEPARGSFGSVSDASWIRGRRIGQGAHEPAAEPYAIAVQMASTAFDAAPATPTS